MSTPPNEANPPANPNAAGFDPKNPLDFPRYIRSIRPTLPDSLPFYVDDELNKVSQSLQALEQASSNDANAKVQEERITRVTADEALAARIVTVETDFKAGDAETKALIKTEEIARSTADEALADQITTVSADLTKLATKTDASIEVERLARATSEEALAAQVTTLDAHYDAADRHTNGRINDEMIVRATADGVLATHITSVEVAYMAADTVLNAAITTEATARASADSAMATNITTVTATANSKNRTFLQGTTPTASAVGDIWLDTSNSNKMTRWNGTSWAAVDDGRIASNAAAITSEATARVSGDSANATAITTVSTTVAGHTSTLSTYGTSISGLQAKYGVKLDVNGYVSGFEQNNGGGTSDFIVRADTFKVIMPGNANIVPFQVTGGGVQIQGTLLVTSSVGTTAIASNAVTNPSSVFTGTAQTISTLGTYTTIQTLAFTATGGTVKVDFSFSGICVSGGGCTIRIQRNGTTVWEGTNLYAFGSLVYGIMTSFCLDTPPAGSTTYTLQVAVSGSTTDFYDRGLSITELKR